MKGDHFLDPQDEMKVLCGRGSDYRRGYDETDWRRPVRCPECEAERLRRDTLVQTRMVRVR